MSFYILKVQARFSARVYFLAHVGIACDFHLLLITMTVSGFPGVEEGKNYPSRGELFNVVVVH